MKDAVFDFLRSALIPVLRSDIAAGASCDVHLRLIAIMAMRTFPYEFPRFVVHDLNFPVVTAYLTIVALGIELGVHDVFIDEFHDGKDGRDIVLHVGNFHVGNGATGRKLLEFALEFELGERVNLLGNVHVIAVGDIALIRNAGNDAETLLQTFGEFIYKKTKKI